MNEENKNISRIPTEIVELPSKGLLYDENTSLHEGKVELRYLTAKEEDILTSRKLIENGEIFKVLLKNILVGDIKYEDILVVDRDALLIMARIMAYGSNYNYKQVCPNCGEINIRNANLEEFNFKEIDEDFLKNSNNLFDFTLPKSKIDIKFKLLNVKDYDNIIREAGNMNKLERKSKNEKTGQNTSFYSKIDHTSSTSLRYIVQEVNGRTDSIYINNFVKNEMLFSDIK